MKVSIEPGVDERVRQSSVKRKTANPFYNEYFKFPATYDDIRSRAVVFVVYDYDKFSRHKLVGEVRIDLSKVETSNSVEMWCDIQKQKLVGAISLNPYLSYRYHLGESTSIFRGFRCGFKILFQFSMKFL